MSRTRAILIASAPILLLIVLSLSFRLLPLLLGESSSQAETLPSEPGGEGRGTVLPAPQRFNPADAATQRKLEAAASGQLDAIRNHDFAAALSFAQPGFRGTMSPDTFGRMIADGYTLMLSSNGVHFKQAQLSEDQAILSFQLTGAGGRKQGFTYSLQQQDGKWYIASCMAAIQNPGPRTPPIPQEASLLPAPVPKPSP